MRPAFDLSVYLVTDPVICARRGLLDIVASAVRGGATMVQLRDKEANIGEFIAIGRALKQILSDSGVPLIVNDRLEAVEAIEADGLHIGQSDISAAAARARLGPRPLLGLWINSVSQLAGVDGNLIDYVGAGPIFGTPTKADHAPPIGFDGLRAIVSACPVPVVAIGGLNETHVGDILKTGAAGVAIVSALCAAEDPAEAARAFVRAGRRVQA